MEWVLLSYQNPLRGVTNPDNGRSVVVISEPIEGVTSPDNGRGVVVTSEPMVMGLTTLPTSSLALISVANSPALTYLIDNPDVMVHAQKYSWENWQSSRVEVFRGRWRVLR